MRPGLRRAMKGGALAASLAGASVFGARDALGQPRAPIRIAGTAFDSIAMRPLVGALVQLVPADNPTGRARSAPTDAAGRWVIDSLVPGRYLATFFHARLDSMEFGAPEFLMSLGVSDDGVTLATSGAARVIAARCPDPADSGAGAAIGRLRDARTGEPIASGDLSARWSEMVLGQGGLRRELHGRAATMAEDGRFTICGLPPGGEVSLLARSGADSLPVTLAVPTNGLVARDLFLGAIAARVTGSVRTAEGHPVAGARVSVVGAARSAVADSAGRWTIDAVPGGTRVLETRGIGFVPDTRVLDVTAEPLSAQDVTLVSLRSLLDTVRITGSRVTRAIAAFEERRRTQGTGRFIGAGEIRRSGIMRASHALERVPGLSIVPLTIDGRTVYVVRSRGGNGFQETCLPTLYVDGVRIPIDDLRDIDFLVDVDEIAGIETYNPGTAPTELSTLDGCTTIAIWTTRARAPR